MRSECTVGKKLIWTLLTVVEITYCVVKVEWRECDVRRGRGEEGGELTS